MYLGRTFIREAVTIAGDYLEGDAYPVFQAPGQRRRKCRPTSEIQAKLNQKRAEKKLARLVHANFTDRDLALHLTYSDDNQPGSEQEAQHILGSFLRRLKRLYKRNSKELKYISVTERGEKSGKAHHHLIISGGVDRDEIENLWHEGYANSDRLQFGENGLVPLTRYMAKKGKSADGIELYRRWNCSKNLYHPEPAVYDGEMNMKDMRCLARAAYEETAWQILEDKYPDYICTSCVAWENPVNKSIYIHYEMKKREALWSGAKKHQTEKRHVPMEKRH